MSDQETKPAGRGKVIVYIVIRVLVIAVMIAQIFNHNWDNVFTCALTLILLLLPSFLSSKMHIVLPNTIEIIIDEINKTI